MKQILHTFRFRLIRSFLLASLIPLLLCFVVLLSIFRFSIRQEMDHSAEQALNSFSRVLSLLSDSFSSTALQMEQDRVVMDALCSDDVAPTIVYSHFFDASVGARSLAPLYLYRGDGLCLYSTEGDPPTDILSTDWGILRSAGEKAHTVVCSADYSFSEPVLRFAYCFTDSEGEPIGYLVSNHTVDSLRSLFSPLTEGSDEYVLLDAFWHPIYTEGSDATVSLLGELRSTALSGGILPKQDEANRYSLLSHEATGLSLLFIQPLSSRQQTVSVLNLVTGMAAIVGILTAIFLSMPLTKHLIRPVSALSDAFHSVEQNDLSVRMGDDSSEEFSRLNRQFNQMVTALQINQEELVEKERTLNNTQLRMLQAQLNPHFLCNTLDTMKWLGKINHIPEVAVISTDLADLLRSSIASDAFIPLEKEAHLLEQYIEIQRIRLSERFTFSLDLPAEYADCTVPKLILQPLAENAILHGIDDMENGHIRVRVTADESRLYLTVSDNGPGFPEQMLGAYHGSEEPREEGHLGLSNIDSFLKKNYGSSYGLMLSNTEEGAEITAVLPITQKGADS